MTQPQTALIIDDDPDSISWLEFVLGQRFPDLRIDSRTEPESGGEYDIFFIDNDFNGRCLAAKLASAIRKRNPQSLIVAFSACLDTPSLKHLINEGCDGACDKSDTDDLQHLFSIVDRYLKEHRFQQTSKVRSKGFFSALHSISDLLREWNDRIESGPVIPSGQVNSKLNEA